MADEIAAEFTLLAEVLGRVLEMSKTFHAA
jgi:hypothetical protein